MFDPILLVITIFFMFIGMIVSGRLKSKFAQYSQERLIAGFSGKEVAEKMLHDNGIYDVKVISVEGELTDHYNPATKTVNLSTDVYAGRNIAAAAVAAHECGHAVQHATAYSWLTMRSKLVPIVNISSKMMNFIMMGALLFAFVSNLYNQALLLIIICQAVIAAFAIVTLPVEMDASARAVRWLDSTGIAQGEERAHARDALKWAGMTYFVAALAAIATLLYFILQFTGRRND